MRFLPIILIFLLLACQKTKTQLPQKDNEGQILKKEAFYLAENYAKSKLINPIVSKPDSHGIFSISDSTKRFELDPKNVHIGLIDEDQNPDAIVSMIVYHANQTVTDEHVVLLHKKGKLEQAAALELNIRVIIIANRKIVAEYHTKPRTSIYYQCVKCKKNVDYQFKNDSLVALN